MDVLEFAVRVHDPILAWIQKNFHSELNVKSEFR